jgi:cytochrome c oxidase cbb3-type subunit 3
MIQTQISFDESYKSSMKKSTDTILLTASITMMVLLTLNAGAQETQEAVKTVAAFPAWAKDSNVYLMSGLLAILLLTIYVLYKANMALMHSIVPKAEEIKKIKASKVISENKPSAIRQVYLKMVDSVPVEKEKDVLLDHDYDGIKELDNNLPPWWKYGFYVTILFAVVYLLYYHVSGEGKLQYAEYAEEVQTAAQEKVARLLASADVVNEETVTALNTPEGLSNGRETFTKLCSACHRSDGGGQVGPNLTDEYWLHGGGIKNVFRTITYGVPAKGMISWQSQLSPKQIQQVASYVLTLKGTNPAGGLPPAGDLWKDENLSKPDSTLKADSTIKKTVALVDESKK